MARSKTDVKARMSAVNGATDSEYTFNNWGNGKYQLMETETGKTVGPVCHGAGEFLKYLKGFTDGARVMK